MKKVLLFGLVLASAAVTSCAKEYKCENADTPSAWTITYSEKDFTDTQMDLLKQTCQADNGEWTAQ